MKIECHRLDPKRVTVRDVVTRVRELSASMVSLALVTVDQLVMKLADRLTRAGFSHAHIIIHVRRFIEYFYHKLLNDDERRMRRSRIRIRLQRLLSIRIVLSLYVSMHRFIHAYDHVIVVNRAECCENVFATPRFLSLMALIPPLN